MRNPLYTMLLALPACSFMASCGSNAVKGATVSQSLIKPEPVRQVYPASPTQMSAIPIPAGQIEQAIGKLDNMAEE